LSASDLATRIQKDMVAAMKAKDPLKVETLRGLSSDLKYRRIQLGAEPTDADVVAVLRSAAKRRKESVEAFRRGQRDDLADREQAELALIEAYLPAEMSDADLDGIIRQALAEMGAAGAAQLGKVMAAVMPKVAGQADGNRVRARVQALLSG
jgi:uncharacterized protein YqeY